MKAEQIVTKPIEVELGGITLLSSAEAEKLDRNILSCGKWNWWWLRSPGKETSSAAYVDDNGFIHDCGNNVSFESGGIRPALRIANPESLNLRQGDRIILAGKEWTAVSNDLILCNEIVGRSLFCMNCGEDSANDYEKSDAKRWLDNWATENGIEIQKQ